MAPAKVFLNFRHLKAYSIIMSKLILARIKFLIILTNWRLTLSTLTPSRDNQHKIEKCNNNHN